MPLSPHLRERILRQLDTLNDEKGYAVLDYVDYVAARYGTKETTPASIFSRFTDGIEDTMRAGKLSASAISQTMGFLNQAVGVLNGVAAAGKSVATDIVNTASDVAKTVTGTTPVSGTPSPAPGGPPATGTDAARDAANPSPS